MLETFGDQPLRRRQRVSDQRRIAEADAGEPHWAVRREHGDIAAFAIVMLTHCRNAGHVEAGRRRTEQPGQVAPIRFQVLGGERRIGEAVLRDDLSCDALQQPARMLRLVQQDAVGVRVGVDEAGRRGQGGSIDLSRRRLAGEVADRRDPIAVHGDIGGARRRARAVDQFRTANDQVRHRRRLLAARRPTRRFCRRCR